MKTVDLKYSLDKLLHYIESEGYVGWDPFDGLSSPIFQLPILRSSKLLRFGFQQMHRRFPFNIRRILAIKKEINPVTLGLCIQGYSYLSTFCPEQQGVYRTKINWCIERLTELQSSGFSGACWGYNFDWESRYVTIPAFTPTVVATGFITNALFELYQLTKNKRAKEICIDSAQFVMNDLNKTMDGKSFCYSYSPIDHQIVYNATMKGARLLGQAYQLTKKNHYKEEGEKTIKFVLKNQKNDGSWFYSYQDGRNWSDNFHTAYIIDSLKSFVENTNINHYDNHLKKAITNYLNTFFTKNGLPKYLSNKIYPLDSTNVAQSIITLINLCYYKQAVKIANLYIKLMQTEKGYFYYRKHKLLIDKNNYMRWNNAWMFVALSKIISYKNQWN